MRFWKLGVMLAAACATAPVLPPSEPIPAEFLTPHTAVRYHDLSYEGGTLTYRPRPRVDSPVHVLKTTDGEKLVSKLVSGDKDLTPPFAAIDSFDVSLARKEVVFSAKRGDNFDAGLVSVDGSEIHWIPNDPADEVAVQWAPRGNRVAYVIRRPSGDLVRVVHVTTSAQFLADFPGGRVDALAWQPDGERYAVAWETADASPRIESMTYDARERRTLVAPAAQLTAAASEVSGGVLIIRPELMHYNEKLPLVVWRTSDRNRWSDARAQLQQENRIACAIIDRDPDAAFWNDMRQHPWIDLTRAFVVNASAPAGATSIRGAADAEPGRVRREGNSLVVPVDVVESFAAGTIAHQLKGSPPANGRNR